MKPNLSDETTAFSRRRFLYASILACVAMQFGIAGAASAQPDEVSLVSHVVIQPAVNHALGNLKHIKAGVLDVAYAELGPANGPVVILLHGWPYDIHSYDRVAPRWRPRAIAC